MQLFSNEFECAVVLENSTKKCPVLWKSEGDFYQQNEEKILKLSHGQTLHIEVTNIECFDVLILEFLNLETKKEKIDFQINLSLDESSPVVVGTKGILEMDEKNILFLIGNPTENRKYYIEFINNSEQSLFIKNWGLTDFDNSFSNQNVALFFFNLVIRNNLTINKSIASTDISMNIESNQSIYLDDGFDVDIGNDLEFMSKINHKTCDIQTTFSIPNFITPNNDGFNDCWILNDFSLIEPCSILITYQNGELVYQSKDFKNNWCPENIKNGVYFFELNSFQKQSKINGSIIVQK